jgi:hypothetical protein
MMIASAPMRAKIRMLNLPQSQQPIQSQDERKVPGGTARLDLAIIDSLSGPVIPA